MISPEIVRRLTVARYLLHLAIDNGHAARDVTSHAAINILQDSIEMFFVAASEWFNLDLGPQAKFNQYLDAIASRLGHEIPYRKKLIEINRVRIASKHDGILPDKKELLSYLDVARDFFEGMTTEVFDADFWSVSLIDLLDNDREDTSILKEAEQQFKDGYYHECLVLCRRAFFVVFEESYNIKRFEEDEPNNVFRFLGSSAPYYSQNAEYIKKSVASPFDYIVRDHSKLDAELTKEGVDHTTFWNIWRLTPEVYRYSKESGWLTKQQPEKYEHQNVKDAAAYVLDSTISIMLKLTLNRRESRTLGTSSLALTLRDGVIRLFTKADRDSSVMKEFSIEAGTTVLGSYRTPGLNRDDYYWNITAFNPDTKFFAFGYISEDDVVSINGSNFPPGTEM